MILYKYGSISRRKKMAKEREESRRRKVKNEENGEILEWRRRRMEKEENGEGGEWRRRRMYRRRM